MSTTKLALPLLWIVAACGSSNNAGADAATDTLARCDPQNPSAVPTYSELYTKYFAVGKPGHCATDGCHNGSNFQIWFCGNSKDSCYLGMTGTLSGPLVDTANPAGSLIVNPQTSPLSWFNPQGPMPFDTPGPCPEGAMAIRAWIADGAKNN